MSKLNELLTPKDIENALSEESFEYGTIGADADISFLNTKELAWSAISAMHRIQNEKYTSETFNLGLAIGMGIIDRALMLKDTGSGGKL